MSGAGLYLWIKTLQLVAFARDRNSHSARYFRILNEVPTVLLIAIVVMVIVRPVWVPSKSSIPLHDKLC